MMNSIIWPLNKYFQSKNTLYNDILQIFTKFWKPVWNISKQF